MFIWSGDVFHPARQGEIPLETDGIPAKAGQKSPLKIITCSAYHFTRSSQWIRTRMKIKLSNVFNGLNVKPAMFGILSRLCID